MSVIVKNRLVEKHVIDKSHPFFVECDALTLKSKNLYNCANYHVRQKFINEQGYDNYNTVDKIFNSTKQADYKALPAKVAQLTLKKLDKNWISFFAATKDYNKNPSKYEGRPKLPKYKKNGGKWNERFLVTYNKQAISKKHIKNNVINPSQTNLMVKSKNATWENFCELRIVVKYGYYVIEVVYEEKVIKEKPNNHRYASIDIGLNNLATIGFNDFSLKSLAINGRPLKSINQFYNKRKAELQAHLSSSKKHTSNKIEKLTAKRYRKVDDYLHKASRYIVNHLVSNNINTLVIGKNKGWKQDINIGKRNNQNFTNIPFARFINIIVYKCKILGINVILHEESYTSKCSFLDNEPIMKHEKYMGRRIKRGLYKSALGVFINADLNGAYNILKKAVPNAFADGIEGVVVHPFKVAIS